jgi:hypothetical protein
MPEESDRSRLSGTARYITRPDAYDSSPPDSAIPLAHFPRVTHAQLAGEYGPRSRTRPGHSPGFHPERTAQLRNASELPPLLAYSDAEPCSATVVVNVTPCQSSLLPKKLRLDDRAEGRVARATAAARVSV